MILVKAARESKKKLDYTCKKLGLDEKHIDLANSTYWNIWNFPHYSSVVWKVKCIHRGKENKNAEMIAVFEYTICFMTIFVI